MPEEAIVSFHRQSRRNNVPTGRISGSEFSQSTLKPPERAQCATRRPIAYGLRQLQLTICLVVSVHKVLAEPFFRVSRGFFGSGRRVCTVFQTGQLVCYRKEKRFVLLPQENNGKRKRCPRTGMCRSQSERSRNVNRAKGSPLNLARIAVENEEYRPELATFVCVA